MSDSEREMFEKMLDYEFADKDGNGKADNELLQAKIEKLGNKAITIKASPTEPTSANVNVLNFNLTEIRSMRMIDPESGFACPPSLNTVFHHELDHLNESLGDMPLAVRDNNQSLPNAKTQSVERQV